MLSRSPQAVRFKSLQEHLSPIAPATLSKLLKELQTLDLIREGKRSDGYELTTKLYDLGRTAAQKQESLEDLCQSHLDNFSSNERVTVSIVSIKHEKLYCNLASFDMESPMLIGLHQERNLNLLGIGACFLYQQQDWENLDLKTQLAAPTEVSEADPKKVQKLIDLAKSAGLFWDPGVCYLGVGRCALPLPTPHRKLALCIGFPSLRAEKMVHYQTHLSSRAISLRDQLQQRLQHHWNGQS